MQQYDGGERHVHRNQTATDESEAQVLRGFYRATLGRDWYGLSGLDGVTLNSRGRTELIQLSGRHVRMRTGRIDWLDWGTLAGLRFLTVLDLSSNVLRGKRVWSVQQRQSYD